MRYFLVVGEASADLHASGLIRSLRAQDKEAEFAFMGGDLMAIMAGRSPLLHYRDVAFMGVLPVLMNLGKIRRAAREVQQAMLDFRPDVVIAVDYAGFNMRYVLPFVRQHLRCPLVYYIAPKLWAWRAGRIKALRRYTDLLLTILPFEEAYFRSRGVRTAYVGNPCVDATRRHQRAIGQEQSKQIALLSGSRRQELKSNLTLMIDSVSPFLKEGYRCVIAGAPGLKAEDYEPYIPHEFRGQIELRFGDTYGILQQSDVALVTSGTATLETALIGTPQVVLYRMGGQRLARWIFDTCFRVPYISLVNLILHRSVVPELIGAEANVIDVRKHLKALLQPSSAERRMQEEGIAELRLCLGDEPSHYRAAMEIVTFIR